MFAVVNTAGYPTIERTADFKDYTGPVNLVLLSPSATHVAPYMLTRTTITCVRLPATVVSISYGAFLGCKHLQTFEASGAVTLADRAFSFCVRLVDIKISPNAEYIGRAVFENCAFATLDAPGVSTIGDFAFAGCSNFKDARFPRAVRVGMHAFDNCQGMQTCELGDIHVIAHSMLKNAAALRVFKVETSVRAIHADAFCGCASLASVTFGHIPSFISPYAFYDRGKLVSTVLHLLRPIGPEWTQESVLKLQSTTHTLAVVAVRSPNLALTRRTIIAAPYLADAVGTVCLCACRFNCSILPLELWLFILELAGG